MRRWRRILAQSRSYTAQQGWQAVIGFHSFAPVRRQAATELQGYDVTTQALPLPARPSKAVFPVLCAASFCHGLNDMMQALLPAVYPILRGEFDLSFAQVGLLTFVYQVTA